MSDSGARASSARGDTVRRFVARAIATHALYLTHSRQYVSWISFDTTGSTDLSIPPTSLITSPQNPYIKDLVRLRKDGNVRRKRGQFLIEGRRSVAAALDQNRTRVSEVIVCERLLGADLTLLEKAKSREVRSVRVSKDVFKKLADVVTPQGIAAVVDIPCWDWEELLSVPDPLLAIACGIQDPGNLGTLIRSCEASGAAGLVALDGTADPFNAKVVRSTAGGLLTLPIVRMQQDTFLSRIEEWNGNEIRSPFRLVATAAEGGTPHRSFDWQSRPLALCIGNEGMGLPQAVESACREKVTIPLHGKSESLNTAVAASILLFEAQSGR